MYVNKCVQQQITYTTQRLHFLIFPCLPKRLVLPLIMRQKRISNKKKCSNLLNFVTFKELQEKSAFLKIAA